MTTLLDTPAEKVVVTTEDDGWHLVVVTPKGGAYVARQRVRTRYTLALIREVLRVAGPAYLCDEIARDEDPLYVETDLRWGLFGYIGRQELAARRALDFGCGSGASTVVLGRLLPRSCRIVGVESDERKLQLARQRIAFYDLDDRVLLRRSPGPLSLPDELGSVFAVILSAVYEHLLPAERRHLMPALWDLIEPGGCLFVNQTPHRWFPVEVHTTNPPLMSYLPAPLALPYARIFRRVPSREPWQQLLERGIRGTTVAEILSDLGPRRREAKLLEPSLDGVSDRIDLWLELSTRRRSTAAKKIFWRLSKAIKAATGLVVVPLVAVALRKRL